MDNQTETSEILVKATAQGFSIAIYGKKEADGTWKCSVERNEITFTDIPINEEATSLGEQRHYDKTGHEFSFEAAFKVFDDSEWFLCHPTKIHADVAGFIVNAVEQRMEEYEAQYPADSPMESFIRKNKIDEWKSKVSAAQAGNT